MDGENEGWRRVSNIINVRDISVIVMYSWRNFVFWKYLFFDFDDFGLVLFLYCWDVFVFVNFFSKILFLILELCVFIVLLVVWKWRLVGFFDDIFGGNVFWGDEGVSFVVFLVVVEDSLLLEVCNVILVRLLDCLNV